MNNDSIMSVLSSNSTNIQKLALDIRKRNKLSDIIFQQVTEIVNDVKTRGDSAIVEYAEKFDGVSLTNDSIKINSDYIKLAYEKADPDQIKALQWHSYEVINLENNKDITLLASSTTTKYQIFKYKNYAYGIQFHIEVKKTTVGDWGCVPEYKLALENQLGLGALEKFDQDAIANI